MANVAAAIAALADPTRRAVFERLSGGPRAAGELAEGLPVSRSAVSQHLGVLLDAGLVTRQSIGTRRLYQVDPDALAALRAYFDGMWASALARAAELTEEER